MNSKENTAWLASWHAGCGVWLLFIDLKLKDAVKRSCETSSPTAAFSLFFNFSLPFLFISCDSEVRIKTNILMAAFMMLAGRAGAEPGELAGRRAGWCGVVPRARDALARGETFPKRRGCKSQRR